jgi:hypothetical protein
MILIGFSSASMNPQKLTTLNANERNKTKTNFNKQHWNFRRKFDAREGWKKQWKIGYNGNNQILLDRYLKIKIKNKIA